MTTRGIKARLHDLARDLDRLADAADGRRSSPRARRVIGGDDEMPRQTLALKQAQSQAQG